MSIPCSKTETPRHKCAGVLTSFHLFTLFRKGTSMETERTLSRPTLTVQDMTVDEAVKPILPLVDTPRCELAPISRHRYLRSQRREEKGFPALGVLRLTALQNLVRTIVSWLSRLLLSIQKLSKIGRAHV